MAIRSGIQRATLVNERTSQASAGTATVATITEINGESLESFDQLSIYAVSSQNLAGGGTITIFFQRAIVPNPDPANAAHWTDWAAMPVTGSTINHILNSVEAKGVTSYPLNGVVGAQIRQNEAMSNGQIYPVHPGDRLRIRELVAGTITTAMIYSIHVTGRIGR